MNKKKVNRRKFRFLKRLGVLVKPINKVTKSRFKKSPLIRKARLKRKKVSFTTKKALLIAAATDPDLLVARLSGEGKRKTALTNIILQMSGRLKGANKAMKVKLLGKQKLGIQSHNQPLQYIERRIFSK